MYSQTIFKPEQHGLISKCYTEVLDLKYNNVKYKWRRKETSIKLSKNCKEANNSGIKNFIRMLLTKITLEKIESVENGIEELILLHGDKKRNINLKVMWEKAIFVQMYLPKTKPQPTEGRKIKLSCKNKSFIIF